MIWKGRPLTTPEEFMRYGIDCCADAQEARQFMREYVIEKPSEARANIGYLTGYYGLEDRRRIFDWFEVVHPIFGRRELSPEECFKLGMAIGDGLRNL
jgi:hypothetical protein